MRLRMLVAAAVGAVFGALGTLESTVGAQQNLSQVPSVISPHGFLVEEVRVGESCVVIVARGGPPNDQVAAIPCNR
jgi:hypothetical protein